VSEAWRSERAVSRETIVSPNRTIQVHNVVLRILGSAEAEPEEGQESERDRKERREWKKEKQTTETELVIEQLIHWKFQWKGKVDRWIDRRKMETENKKQNKRGDRKQKRADYLVCL
jgi:hypothetical protein